MDPLALFQLIETPEFQRGVLAGVAAAAIGWVLRRFRVDWGLLWLATVTVASVWAQVFHGDAVNRGLTLHAWVAPAGAIAIALMSFGLIRNRDREELIPALVVSLGGVWATVPDTETMRVLLGVITVLLWLAWPRQRLPIRRVGAIAVAAVATWAGIVGSVGRPGAYVGAFGSLASLALLSIPRTCARPWLGFLAHVLLVAGWSRLAGLSQSAASAFAIGSVITAAVIAARYATSWKRVSVRG